MEKYEDITTAEYELYQKSPTFQRMETLFRNGLVVADLDGESQHLEVIEAEPFEYLLDNQWCKAFDFDGNEQEIERNPNEIFVFMFRGSPIINIVTDGQKRSVIYVKRVSIEGEEVSVKELLNRMGYERNSTYQEYKEQIIGAFDSKQMEQDHTSPLRIPVEGGAPEEISISIRRKVSKELDRRAENSLGVFRKIA